jgi:hypothetical protein
MDRDYVDNTIQNTVIDTAVDKKIPRGPNFIALAAYISFLIYLVNNHDWFGLTSAAGYTCLLLSSALEQASIGTLGYVLLVFGLPFMHWWEVFGVVGYGIASTWSPEVGRFPAAVYHGASAMTTTHPFMILFRTLIVIYLSVL